MTQPMPPIEAAFIGRNRRAIVRYLMAKHALDPGDAIAMRLPGPGVKRAMRQLVLRGIVYQQQPGHFYLDLAAWRADADRRRQQGVIIALAVVGVAVAGLMLLYRG